MSNLSSFFILVFLCACLPLSAAVLFDNGRSDYVIVQGRNARAVEKTAAKELREHVKQMGGVDLPVVESLPAGRKAIRITSDLLEKDDTVILKIQENGDLLISGSWKRGALYAVYTLLEEYGGVRWWTPSVTHVPWKKRWEIPKLDYRYTSPFAVREVFYRPIWKDEVFAARMKNNGHFGVTTAAYGGHNPILGFCHTFNRMIPAFATFRKHPEYFAEIKGKRSLGIDVGQLCLSNPQVLRIITEKTLEQLRFNPDATIISVSQNDNSDYCRCKKCAALDEREGSPSGSIIRFVNQVADAVKREFPNVWVETLAYTYTQKAPRTIRPRDNMVIRLCSFNADYSAPLNSEKNAAFRKDIEDWGRIAKQLYIWNYVVNFANHWSPFPSVRYFAEDLRFMRDHHVRAVFEQGPGLRELSDLAPLRQWLLSRLMWNPDLNQEALTREFLNGYYGAAAPFVREYMELGYQAVDASGMQLRCNGSVKWLSLDTLLKMRQVFDKAEETVGKEPELLDRVRTAAVSVNHVILGLDAARIENANTPEGGKLRSAVDLEKLFDETYQTVMKNPESWREHNGSPSERFKILKGRISGNWNFNAERPALCEGLRDDEWALFDTDSFRYFGAKAVLENGKKVVSMPQDGSWAIHLYFPDFPEQMKTWRIYAWVRSESSVPENIRAGTFGLHNPGGKTPVKQLMTGDLNGKEYRLVELGTAELKPKGYLYFAGNDKRSKLFVKGVLLVRGPAVERPNFGKMRPELCSGLPDDAWDVLTTGYFRYYGGAKTVNDSGVSAAQLPQKEIWAVQASLPQVPAGSRWQLYAVVRCESGESYGLAGKVGFHNPGGKGVTKQLLIEKFKGQNGYQVVNLGMTTPRSGSYFFAAGFDSKAQIFVKEFILIRK